MNNLKKLKVLMTLSFFNKYYIKCNFIGENKDGKI